MTSPRGFGSDNQSGAHPAVLRAIQEASAGDVRAYGGDAWTARASWQLCDAFGAEAAFLVFTGTAANVLGLSLLLRPYQGVICADTAHLNIDECGAAERILGCKLLTAAAPGGKLTPELIAGRLGGRGDEHRVQPRAVEIAQVTELGTCYTLAELRRLGEFCRDEGLLVYMDGARLANAAAFLGCTLAELAEHADVLSFGGTKNGAVGAEAVLVMRPELVPDARFLRKQQMQLGSKMRFLAAQFIALLDDDLWLANARRSNETARRLADGIRGLPGVSLSHPVESNAVFATLAPARTAQLQRDLGVDGWEKRGHTVRWMTSFDTTEAEVDAFTAAVRATASTRGST